METIRLYRIAERKGIPVDRYPLPLTRSVSLKSGKSRRFRALTKRCVWLTSLGTAQPTAFIIFIQSLISGKSMKDMQIFGR